LRYLKLTRKFLAKFENLVTSTLLPVVLDDTRPQYLEANSAVAIALEEWVEGPEYAGELAQIHAAADEHSRREMARVMNVQFGKAANKAQTGGWVRENVQLIKSVSFERLGDMRQTVEAHVLSGDRVETLRERLMQDFELTKSRASLIARDQTLKLTNQLNQQRATSVGVQTYTWITSRDERVRGAHKALDGTIQRYDSPPVTNPRTGERNHPGQDYQCRCVAVPNTDELLGIGEPAPLFAPPAPPPPEPPRWPEPAPRRAAPPARAIAQDIGQQLKAQDQKGLQSSLEALRSDLAGRLGLAANPLPLKAVFYGEGSEAHAFANGYAKIKEAHYEVGLAVESDVRVAVHETIHTMGGMQWEGVGGAARNFEEVVTESLTQKYLGTGAVKLELPKLTGDIREAAHRLAPQLEGSYTAWRARTLLAISHVEGVRDGAKVLEILEQAGMAWKRKNYATPSEAIDSFIDALKPRDRAAREAYQELFGGKWGPSSVGREDHMHGECTCDLTVEAPGAKLGE
jgi:SPP1 gp7 family putative phage head morphogenesis protein